MAIEILMPALSPTMEEGTLAKWHVKEGDKVSSGDVIAEIETDKATMEVEAVDEGTVAKILVAAGTENVKVNVPIAVLVAEGEDAAAVEAPKPQPKSNGSSAAPAPAAPPQAATPQVAPPPVAAAPASAHGTRIAASPLAKRIAKERGIDIAAVSGSGPHGRIVKRDVLAAQPGAAAKTPSAEAKAPAPQPAKLPNLGYADGTFTAVPLDGMRKTIARRLTQSKVEVPHYYLTIDCELDKLLAMRAELNAMSPQGPGAFKISVNDFLIRASALALVKVPDANASWTDDAILRHHSADVAVAVALDGGLITPIIRKAETKGLGQIAREAKELAEKARARKLKPEEYQGGTFSISNLGMFGIKSFTAVINPPQSMIMAVGAGEQRPVVRDGALAVATVMTVTLSCDHRVVDGALGARFLEAFKAHVQSPLTMML